MCRCVHDALEQRHICGILRAQRFDDGVLLLHIAAQHRIFALKLGAIVFLTLPRPTCQFSVAPEAALLRRFQSGYPTAESRPHGLMLVKTFGAAHTFRLVYATKASFQQCLASVRQGGQRRYVNVLVQVERGWINEKSQPVVHC